MLWNEPNNLSHWDRTLDPEWALFAEMVGLAGERIGQVAPGADARAGRHLADRSAVRPQSLRTRRWRGDRRGRRATVFRWIGIAGTSTEWPRAHRANPRGERRKADAGRPRSALRAWSRPTLQAWAVDATLERARRRTSTASSGMR